jgi:probable rRNA maturation factor
MKVLSLRNRQRTRRVDVQLLRKVIRFLLEELRGQDSFELGIHLVGRDEMARINETFLQHAGSTDVITFNHNEISAVEGLHGEIFISVDDAVKQAREFGTTWQSELARYIVHGVLHLEGFDDLERVGRKKMKAEENRVVKLLTQEFAIAKLQRRPTRLK